MKNKLKKLLENSTNDLEKYVIEDILDNENIESYIKDILQHGCQSGTVSSLIYYTDTRAFYIKYIDEIDNLVQDINDNLGGNILSDAKFPLYNWLAWLAFEETTRNIAYKLNIEY